MSIIQVNHIQSACRARFSTLIDMTDVSTNDSNQKDTHFLSRSLAAFAIAAAANIEDALAAQSVVDEFHDDGIDAFFFDKSEHIAYIAQTKWIKDGLGSPDTGSILKFIQGVNHLLENKVELLGKKMQAKASEINDVLADSQATFVLLVAYTGRPPLSAEAITPLQQLLSDLNDDGDLVTLQVMKQKEIHEVVEKGAMGAPIDLRVMLQEFGQVREPYVAYYGQVEVSDLSSWAAYGNRLYHKNIRSFKGSTDVNDAIVTTIKDTPENFLYFNNGITLLCSELNKQPLGGKTTTTGVFDCKGASVINGAQTVGSILTALALPTPAGSSNVVGTNSRVMMRLISLVDCPPNFAYDVTRAANTQNRIEKRDFAALDENQARLRSELMLSLDKEYVFRTGDPAPSADKGCTLDEAVVALACAHADLTHAVNAKQAIGRFYEDITKPPYTILFNPSLTAVKMWRSVEILRSVDALLRAEQKDREGKEKLCAIHFNRVILHLVFMKLPKDMIETEVTQAQMNQIPELVADYLRKISEEITLNYATSYVGNISKNITKCKQIAASIM